MKLKKQLRILIAIGVANLIFQSALNLTNHSSTSAIRVFISVVYVAVIGYIYINNRVKDE